MGFVKSEPITCVLLLGIFTALSLPLSAQDSDSPERSPLVPAPVPFSLDAESAVYCIDLLKNNRILLKSAGTDSPGIVAVKTVWSRFLDYDERFPPGHRRRYEIIVNGAPLDWNRSYIEYGGTMVNLRLLFLYRNQYPPEGLEYYFPMASR